MKKKQKATISKLFKKHLRDKYGDLDISIEQVFAELPEFWRILDNKGWIPPGMTFQHFDYIAQHACHERWVSSVHDTFRNI